MNRRNEINTNSNPTKRNPTSIGAWVGFIFGLALVYFVLFPWEKRVNPTLADFGVVVKFFAVVVTVTIIFGALSGFVVGIALRRREKNRRGEANPPGGETDDAVIWPPPPTKAAE